MLILKSLLISPTVNAHVITPYNLALVLRDGIVLMATFIIFLDNSETYSVCKA